MKQGVATILSFGFAFIKGILSPAVPLIILVLAYPILGTPLLRIIGWLVAVLLTYVVYYLLELTLFKEINKFLNVTSSGGKYISLKKQRPYPLIHPVIERSDKRKMSNQNHVNEN